MELWGVRAVSADERWAVDTCAQCQKGQGDSVNGNESRSHVVSLHVSADSCTGQTHIVYESAEGCSGRVSAGTCRGQRALSMGAQVHAETS